MTAQTTNVSDWINTHDLTLEFKERSEAIASKDYPESDKCYAGVTNGLVLMDLLNAAEEHFCTEVSNEAFKNMRSPEDISIAIQAALN